MVNTVVIIIFQIISKREKTRFVTQIIHREYATGKGYADLVMIPRRNVNKPALIIELKFNQSTDAAIQQIKRKNYPAKLAEYTGDILLVGINYDKNTKQHTCQIERYRM